MFHLCDEEKLGDQGYNNFIIQIQGFGLSHQTKRLHKVFTARAAPTFGPTTILCGNFLSSNYEKNYVLSYSSN
jgi:hypothetical protein